MCDASNSTCTFSNSFCRHLSCTVRTCEMGYVVGLIPQLSQTPHSGFKIQRIVKWNYFKGKRVADTLAPATPKSGVQVIHLDYDINTNAQMQTIV